MGNRGLLCPGDCARPQEGSIVSTTPTTPVSVPLRPLPRWPCCSESPALGAPQGPSTLLCSCAGREPSSSILRSTVTLGEGSSVWTHPLPFPPCFLPTLPSLPPLLPAPVLFPKPPSPTPHSSHHLPPFSLSHSLSPSTPAHPLLPSLSSPFSSSPSLSPPRIWGRCWRGRSLRRDPSLGEAGWKVQV